ncbi:MAG: winged helix-turn-helix transcriptional regulator [Candidatus Thermoplasmatota archaeon]|jgi:predicted transcriptional regulator|nr:winged helix-turn-helix transcriptional regulator [Candidatus Thermoplasmatota archaeon]
MPFHDITIDNPVRSRLYDIINCEPGITFKELSRKVNYSVGTLQYHLGILQKEEIIRKELKNGERAYYVFETKSFNVISSIFGSKDQLSSFQREILTVITDNPKISQNEITDVMRVNRFILHYHLKCLLDRDLIQKRKIGRVVYYSRVDEEEMKRRLLLKLIDELLLDKIDEQTYQRLKKVIL